MINSFFKKRTKVPSHQEPYRWSVQVDMSADPIPHLNAPGCIFLQPLDTKALDDVNLEVNPLAQELQRVNNHIFLTMCPYRQELNVSLQVRLSPG